MAVAQSALKSLLSMVGYAVGANLGAGTTLNLNAAYTYGSAGNCYAMRYIPHDGGTIDAVYFSVNAKTGSAGTITVEIRNYNDATPTKPGSTVLATVTVTPAATYPGWQVATLGSPLSITGGTPYWICVTPSGTADASNFYAINTGGGPYGINYNGRKDAHYTSANGFSTTTSNVGNNMPNIIIEASYTGVGKTYHGNPYTSSATYLQANNTRARGVLFSPPAYMWLQELTTGWLSCAGTVKVFEGTAPDPTSATPLGTAILFSANTAQAAGTIRFPTPILLVPGKTYRIVYIPATNDQEPAQAGIGAKNSATTAINACRYFGGDTYYYTYWNGTAWVDNQDVLCPWTMLLAGIESNASGSGPIGENMALFKNVAGQKLAVNCFHIASGAPLPDASAGTLTAAVSKDAGTLTALTDTSATAMGNNSGTFFFDLTQAETNGDMLRFNTVCSDANYRCTPVTAFTASALPSVVLDPTGLDAIAVTMPAAGTNPAAMNFRQLFMAAFAKMLGKVVKTPVDANSGKFTQYDFSDVAQGSQTYTRASGTDTLNKLGSV